VQIQSEWMPEQSSLNIYFELAWEGEYTVKNGVLVGHIKFNTLSV